MFVLIDASVPVTPLPAVDQHSLPLVPWTTRWKTVRRYGKLSLASGVCRLENSFLNELSSQPISLPPFLLIIYPSRPDRHLGHTFVLYTILPAMKRQNHTVLLFLTPHRWWEYMRYDRTTLTPVGKFFNKGSNGHNDKALEELRVQSAQRGGLGWGGGDKQTVFVVCISRASVNFGSSCVDFTPLLQQRYRCAYLYTVFVWQKMESEVRAKKPSITLNLGTNGLKVTSEPPSTSGKDPSLLVAADFMALAMSVECH
ncbi:hypothetical protein J6590_008220 [Homalodisca vitripennis]|nr:hypothetical protein J6590_008220 [Homalodisca vitripennis]